MKILLATDGSKYALEAALQGGKIIGNLNEKAVKVITVIDNFTPMATEPFITSEEFLVSIEKEMREDAGEIIRLTENVLKQGNSGIRVEKEILVGSAKKIIVKEAEKWGADLIIVGSHGRGFWGRALVGSVSDAVVHNAPCSVLVVKNLKAEEKELSPYGVFGLYAITT
jgi:nucleotide-binding universal stress UspA family protein